MRKESEKSKQILGWSDKLKKEFVNKSNMGKLSAVLQAKSSQKMGNNFGDPAANTFFS